MATCSVKKEITLVIDDREAKLLIRAVRAVPPPDTLAMDEAKEESKIRNDIAHMLNGALA